MRTAIEALLAFGAIAIVCLAASWSPSGAQDVPAPALRSASGYATWYSDPAKSGWYAAAPWWHFGMAPENVTVCASRCIGVVVSDFCACGDRHGTPTVIDLSPSAFARLAPLSAGVVTVTVTRTPMAPETDVE